MNGSSAIAGINSDRRDEKRRQLGASALELLMLAFPICLLSMVITSKLAATSTMRVRAQWQASLQAQQGAVNVCGSSAQLAAPWLNQAAADTAVAIHDQVRAVTGSTTAPATLQNRVNAQLLAQGQLQFRTVGSLASLLAHITHVGDLMSDLKTGMSGLRTLIENNPDFPPDLLTQSQLAGTNWSTKTATLAPPTYYFKPLADRMMPEQNPSVSASAAFICNEPADATKGNGKNGKDSRLDSIYYQLVGWSFNEATRFY